MASLFDSLINHRQKKRDSTWLKWAWRILQRRGHPAPPVCADGFSQIVAETFPIGKGTAFFSKACAGCNMGDRIVREYSKLPPSKQEDFRNSFGMQCAFLKAPFVTEQDVEVGDVITVQL